MGLDMYLYAKRQFDPDGSAAARILGAANTTLFDLQVKSRDEWDKEIYLSRWDFEEGEQRRRSTEVMELAGLLPLGTKDSPSGSLAWVEDKVVVGITCMYWRKANSIHSWFVQNCQDGVDECQVSDVSAERLAELKTRCRNALGAYNLGDRHAAEEIMTPRSGFFFGSTEIDEWWARDLERTIEEIARVVIAAAEIPGAIQFQYHSSW